MPDDDPLIAELRDRLAPLQPTSLQIDDDSHLHAGHAGSAGGARHFTVHIVAPCFSGLTPVQRHRLVYDRLSNLIPYPVHALALDARAP
jgi:BolA protein